MCSDLDLPAPPEFGNSASIGPFVRWLLSHLSEMGAVLAAFRDVFSAPSAVAKLQAAKLLIDALIPLMGDFPTLATTAQYTVSAAEVADCEAQYTTAGFDWATLLTLIKWIIETFFKTPAPA